MVHRLSCSVARGMWDLPGPGIKPASPTLTCGFFILELVGKPYIYSLDECFPHLDIYVVRLPVSLCN